MAFCSKCGAQSEGNDRFCVKCGNDMTAAAAPAGQAVAAPPTYAAPGPAPIAVAMPLPAQQKRSGLIIGAVAIALLAGGYYYYHHSPQTPAQGSAPAQPGASPAQPGTAPGQQPGTPGQSGNNAALVRLQYFGGRWVPVNGYVEVSSAAWRNESNLIMQSATLQCVQYAGNGAALTQMQTLLNGPVAPARTSYFGPFQMGAISPYEARIGCSIVDVTPAP